MTAPYEYTLGDMRSSVESYWGSPLIVFPLVFPELTDKEIPHFLQGIVESCGLKDNISFESLRMLAHYSGGIPRTFVQLLIQSCKEAHLAGNNSIEYADAQTAIYNAERSYQDYGPSELQLLDQISAQGAGLNAASTLLRSPIGLLVMPPQKGEYPFRIHPLAESTINRYRSRQKKVTA